MTDREKHRAGSEILMGCIAQSNDKGKLNAMIKEAVNKPSDMPDIETEWIAKPVMIRTPSAKNYYCSACKADTNKCTPYCPMCGRRMKNGKI